MLWYVRKQAGKYFVNFAEVIMGTDTPKLDT